MTRIRRGMMLAFSLLLISATAVAAPKAYQLSVSGLSCPFCAYGIEKQLHQIKGVDRLTTDVRSGTITVVMTEGATLDEATAKRAVQAAGFTLEGFEQIQATTSNDLEQRP
jgi:copper chaperone CopZ